MVVRLASNRNLLLNGSKFDPKRMSACTLLPLSTVDAAIFAQSMNRERNHKAIFKVYEG